MARRRPVAALRGEKGAAWAIPILAVRLLMITHVTAFSLLLRRREVVAS
jgi:hypothetical protein